MKFLFWNTKRRGLTANVARLASSPGAEVVFLAENTEAPAVMATALTAQAGRTYRHLPVPGCLIRTYTTLAPADISLELSSQRFVIWQLRSAAAGTTVVTAVHLPSKLRYSESTQRKVASDLAEEIRRVEKSLNRAPSLLIGDVNMNPFDPGMIEADALYAVCSRAEAGATPPLVNGKRYPMFFNPMWSHMGDGVAKPPGTFYRRTGDNDCIFFHTLDQVLVRPALIPRLSAGGGIRVLVSDGTDQFITARDIPRKQVLSDHLPVHSDISL